MNVNTVEQTSANPTLPSSVDSLLDTSAFEIGEEFLKGFVFPIGMMVVFVFLMAQREAFALALITSVVLYFMLLAFLALRVWIRRQNINRPESILNSETFDLFLLLLNRHRQSLPVQLSEIEASEYDAAVNRIAAALGTSRR